MNRTFKLLIAYDGSKAADAALADLKSAAIPAKCEAKIVTVADLWVPPADMTAGAAEGWYAQAYETAQLQNKAAVKQAKIIGQKAEKTIKSLFPAWKTKLETSIDHPAQGILAAAEKQKPDLIVLGSHGQGALGRLFLGSVSTKVLNHAHSDVRIVRHPGRQPAALRLLVAIDGSRDSTHAVNAVAKRPWPKGTQVHLVVVVDERLRMAGAMLTRLRKPGTGFKAEGWLKTLVEEAEQTLSRGGMKVTSLILEGDPRDLLIKEAKRLKPHCLFLGSRGLNGLQRFFLGSVSTHVAVHAPCSVEIVRPVA